MSVSVYPAGTGAGPSPDSASARAVLPALSVSLTVPAASRPRQSSPQQLSAAVATAATEATEATEAVGEATTGGSPAKSKRKGQGKNRRLRKNRGNGSRAQTLVQFLLDTFGRDFLRSGSGVVDVAGGSGELSFELSYMYSWLALAVDRSFSSTVHA